jgi:hypothetical protein
MGDTGTGESGQYEVARAIGTVCQERGCQFAVLAGDNIYEYGPKSADDPQFDTKFEKPYAALSFPFFMALGNHDQSGLIPGSGVHPEVGNREVEYSKKSAKWIMPGRYYSFKAPLQGTHPIIEFFVLDTNVDAPQNRPPFDAYRPGRKYDLGQKKWLHDGLAQSETDWKIVVGHHPYRNNGAHGNAGEMEGLGLARGGELKKLYEAEVCGKADWIMTGHDHSLQWLKPFLPCSPKTQFLISGAAAKTYSLKKVSGSNEAVWQSYGHLGFFWIEATAREFKVVGYQSQGGKPVLSYEGLVKH